MRVRLPWKKELAPAGVIRWLRSAEGEEWAEGRLQLLYRHGPVSGVFADVLPDPAGGGRRAAWPDPFGGDEL